MSELAEAIAVVREARDQVAAELQRIEFEAELDPADSTPYPLLCCMCHFRGEDFTEVDMFLSSIYDGVSCHHPAIKDDPGRQEAIRRFKNCMEFRKRVRIGG